MRCQYFRNYTYRDIKYLWNMYSFIQFCSEYSLRMIHHQCATVNFVYRLGVVWFWLERAWKYTSDFPLPRRVRMLNACDTSYYIHKPLNILFHAVYILQRKFCTIFRAPVGKFNVETLVWCQQRQDDWSINPINNDLIMWLFIGWIFICFCCAWNTKFESHVVCIKN